MKEKVSIILLSTGLVDKKNTQNEKGVTMTRYARKCVQEFLASDGWTIKAGNLKGAANEFSTKQEGCCPKNEVLLMFRRAILEGTIKAIREDDLVVAYRSLTDFERERALEQLHNQSLRAIRKQKDRTPKPRSLRHYPAPPISLAHDPKSEQFNDGSTPERENQLVNAS